MEVADQSHLPGGILQNAVLKNFANLMQSICAGVSFSIKLEAIMRKHLFYEICLGDCFYQKSF